MQLSDSAAFIILASIAGVYFSITAACTVAICRILCWKKRCIPNLAPSSKHQEYELRGTGGFRSHTDFVPGGRAGKWQRHIAGQSRRSNGIKNGTFSQEGPTLPRIEEGREEMEMEVRNMGEGALRETEGHPTTDKESTTPRNILLQGKRKVKGRTNSTKLLLEETDGGSNWTITSSNDASGSVELVSSMTGSLPGQSLSQCGRPHPHHPLTAELKNTTGIDVTKSLPPSSLSNVVNKTQERRTRRQLSVSTHSLPRQSTSNKQTTSGSDALPWEGGSRPKLRRYASIAPDSSSPSLEPRLLVKPLRSGSRSRINRLNSLDSSTITKRHLSITTSVELERNFYTLQTTRNGVRREQEEEDERQEEEEEEGLCTSSQDSVLKEDSSNSEESSSSDLLMSTDQTTGMVTVIDIGHDGQDSSYV